MNDRIVLVVRHHGSLWGVPSRGVRAVASRPGGYRVELESGALEADELVGMASGLTVWAPGPVLRRFWSEPCAGLAVWARQPLVVIDVEHPPRALRASEGDRSHAQRHP